MVLGSLSVGARSPGPASGKRVGNTTIDRGCRESEASRE